MDAYVFKIVVIMVNTNKTLKIVKKKSRFINTCSAELRAISPCNRHRSNRELEIVF
jgi:hypothetical protein